MTESKKIKVLSSVAQIGDVVSEIGGERVHSWVLIQGSLDPHSYELVKGDGEKLERADLIFYNGLGLEHGASLSSYLYSSNKAMSVGDEILKKVPDRILYRDHAIDPHIWMDISLWEQALDPIVQWLTRFDPEGGSYYRQRADILHERMYKIHCELSEIMQQVPSEQRYLVTSHDAFQYFTRSYLAEKGEAQWSDRFSAPEGLAPDGQLSSRDIERILQFLQMHQVTVLFPESNVSRDSIRKVLSSGRELGLSLSICKETLYGDALDQNLNYLDAMRHNAKVIAQNLSKNECN